jgi:hypothetical protein
MFADLIRLLLAVSRAPFFSSDVVKVALALGLAGWPFSSSRYSDSKLLTDVAVFSYDCETNKQSN